LCLIKNNIFSTKILNQKYKLFLNKNFKNYFNYYISDSLYSLAISKKSVNLFYKNSKYSKKINLKKSNTLYYLINTLDLKNLIVF
jgi:hypothetical protein